ncbi:HlyD family secretion protein [Pseudomonas sp. PB120]|uniref:HlyD family secretion protein n=1 Tax=Pseudomonas sp. PB120 TaxID=2494700 RepID=UPI0012FD2261|nr:HlyD family secretion protein [Pseudomonas sp. PB120]MVV48804.1 HlyD family secretion protein [Pseudomonas sp. PB120]
MTSNATRLQPVEAERSPSTPSGSQQAQPQAPAQPVQDSALPPSRQRVRLGLFLLLPAVLAGSAWLYVTGGQVISTDNAYIQADRVGVSTDVAGIVESVEVTDNQSVTKGQVLFRLRPEPFEIALQSAKAQLADVRNQIMNLKASYAQAQAEIAQAQAEIPYYQKNLARLEQLVSVSAVSKTLYDDAHHNLETTQQKVAVAKAQAQTILAQLGGRIDSPLELQPAYLQAQARIDEAARNLKNATVTAPFDGIVTNVDSLSPGAYLQPPQSGFSLVASDRLWVAASPKETELTHMQEGQPVTITVDSYPGVIWHGRVESISPASGSSFALLPAQNTTGNWVKVVQRIPVRIHIDDTAGKPPLRHGMSVEADIDTGRSRGLPEFMANALATKSSPHE